MKGKHRPSLLERIQVDSTMVFKNFLKFICLMLFFSGATAAEPDWREMKTGKIDYDLQNSPLKIRTDSPFGSGDEVKLTFLGLDNKAAGGLRIKLDTTLEYYLSDCDNSYIDVPTSLPSSLLTEGRKIWKITKTPEPGIIVHCNEHEILKIQLSDTVCTNQKKWSESWSRQAKKIQFNSYFREYDYYYHPTECTGLKEAWTSNNVLSGQDFPVVEGTVLTLSCRGGEEIEGDKTVICVKDTEYQYTEEPKCYWIPVGVNAKIDYDFENSPLRIKTDSSIGSNNKVSVMFSPSSDNSNIGKIAIQLLNEPQYRIEKCFTAWKKFSTTLPADDNRIWTLTKTSQPAGINIDCNDKEILNFEFSDTTCTGGHKTNWMNFWGKEMKKINFQGDTASDFYQHPPECTGLKEVWSNVLSDQDFPVVEGTVLTLSCRGGEEIEGDKTVICVKDTEYELSVAPKCYWKPVVLNKHIDYDFENSPLRIKTDSLIGSNQKMIVSLYASSGGILGQIQIRLNDEPQYWIKYCRQSWAKFSQNLPENDNRDWKITKTSQPAGLTIHCNNTEILNFQFSETTCTGGHKTNWMNFWGKEMKKINFQGDTASDFYQHPPECTGLKEAWTINNVLSDQEFPIVEGTVLTLSCRGGEEIEGDKSVTCVKDTEYDLSVEPKCYWKPVVLTNTKIDYDLENVPLIIKTDSLIGSKNQIAVNVYSSASGSQQSGRIQIHLLDKPKYRIEKCRLSWTELTTTLPVDDNRVWRITKTSNPVTIIIDCNEKEILNFMFSEETCTNYKTNWMNHWDKEMKKINFQGDTASDFYQHPPECTGLNANWYNVLSDQDFPVVEGTVLTLGCRGGEEIEGDKTVICVKDTEYQYTEEAKCYWQTVETNKLIEYDLENSPIRIKTDSPIGSGNTVFFQTFSFNSLQIGRISIQLATVPKYQITFCHNSKKEFPVSIPASDNEKRVWKITKLSQPVRIIIHCDNTEILNLQLSESICSNHKANWMNFWGKEIKRIKFISDSASDFFSPAQVSECTSLTSTWNNIETDTEFPVTSGTVVTLHCEEGYRLTGSDKVTCATDSMFTFSSEPTCTSEKQCTGLKASWTNMITTTNFPVIQGKELSLSCGQGYGLKGDGTVTCVADTEFSVEVEPRCVEQCHNFKRTWRNLLVPAGKKLPVFKGTVLDLKCENGYQMSGDTTVTCEMNTDFTYENDPPQCTAVCDGLTPTWSTTNMVPTPESVFPITKGETLTLSCEPGYELTGDKEVTCDQFQTFTFIAEPLCSACPAGKYSSGDMDLCQQCEGETYSTGTASSCTSCHTGTANVDKTACAGFCPQFTVLNANISPSGTVKEGLVVTVTCSRRFLLIGSKTVECNTDGSWDTAEPHCKKIGIQPHLTI